MPDERIIVIGISRRAAEQVRPVIAQMRGQAGRIEFDSPVPFD